MREKFDFSLDEPGDEPATDAQFRHLRRLREMVDRVSSGRYDMMEFSNISKRQASMEIDRLRAKLEKMREK